MLKYKIPQIVTLTPYDGISGRGKKDQDVFKKALVLF